MIVKLRKPYTVEIAASHGRGTAAVAELELPAERTFSAVQESEGKLRLTVELTGRGVIIPLSVVVPESAVEVVLK
jgi:hypothetical protein